MQASASAARSVSSSGSTRLGLGVAEAAVELEQPGPVGGEDQPGVQHADVRRAGGGEVVDDRLHERLAVSSSAGSSGDRRRGVGAHAAGVGPGVALADALVVLGERQRHGRAAVAEREQRALRAGRRSSSTIGPAAAKARIAASVSAARRRARRRPCRRPGRLLDDHGRAHAARHQRERLVGARRWRENAGDGIAEAGGERAGVATSTTPAGPAPRSARSRRCRRRCSSSASAGGERGLRPDDDEVGLDRRRQRRRRGRVGDRCRRRGRGATAGPARSPASRAARRRCTRDLHDEHALEGQLGRGLADRQRVAAGEAGVAVAAVGAVAVTSSVTARIMPSSERKASESAPIVLADLLDRVAGRQRGRRRGPCRRRSGRRG